MQNSNIFNNKSADLGINPDTQLVTVKDSLLLSVMWNKAIQEAVINTLPESTISSLVCAIIPALMFNTWSVYDLVSTQVDDYLQSSTSEITQANKSEVMSYAAYRVLTELFPAQTEIFDELMDELGFNSNNNTYDTANPAGIGNVMGAELLELFYRDGSNQSDYSDITNDEPVNTHVEDIVSDSQSGDDTVNNPVQPIVGTRDDDILNGDKGNDILNADRGDDILNAGRGDDILNAGRGDDILNADRGDDTLNAGRGDDTLNAGRGDDILNADRGDDILNADRGDDILMGGRGDDVLMGGRGDDILNGYSDGGTEYDTLVGGRGFDTFVLGSSVSASYLGNGYATIEDWNYLEDTIEVFGSSHQYFTAIDNLSGSSLLDTLIYFNSDLVAVVQDTTNVSVFRDFSYIEQNI